MSGGTTDEEDKATSDIEEIDSYDPFEDQVIDHKQISQSVEMDDEPPTPTREGGRG
jgi:hypothetical protein